MRCHQVQRRIIRSEGPPDECLRDDKVCRHIENCRKCRLFLQAESMLRHDLRSAASDDMAKTVSFADLKANVEKLAAKPDNYNNRENILMKILTYPILTKPRLGITLAVISVIIAFVTLVPFHFSRTVGYEVAVATADDDVIIDENKVDDLLKTLGIENASYSLGDCDPKCKVIISDLKSKEDVDILITALDEIGQCKVVYIKPVIDEDNITIMDEAKHRITIRDESTSDEEEIHSIVIDKLNALNPDSSNPFSIVMKVKENDDESRIDIKFEGKIENPSDLLDSALNTALEELNGISALSIIENKAGDEIMELTTKDGVKHVIDLNDPDLVSKLRELGISVYGDGMMHGGDGSQEDESDQSGGDDNPESMKSNAVPESFELYQNAPNPFNPVTDIRYYLPESGYVSLEIFNMNGQKVRTLVDGYQDAGEHTVTWDAKNDSGESVASGIYLYRFRSGDTVISKKMTLLK
jgi:hypothetical protein